MIKETICEAKDLAQVRACSTKSRRPAAVRAATGVRAVTSGGTPGPSVRRHTAQSASARLPPSSASASAASSWPALSSLRPARAHAGFWRYSRPTSSFSVASGGS